MKKSEFNQGVTTKVFAHDHVRADGANTIYLRVIIARRKREFNLKVFWPRALFDARCQEVLPRYPKDKDVESANMIINEAKARASRIKLRYFSESKKLTLDLFQNEFENYESRDNFLFYWLQKQNELHKRGIITKETFIRHNTNLGRLKDFLGNPAAFSMADLTSDLIQNFQTWLRKKKKLKYNTWVNCLKNVKAYVNHAKHDGHRLGDPFDGIALRYQPGERQSLEKCERDRLKALFSGGKLSDLEEEVLRKFLFSCYTGIRISDSAQVTSGMIRNDTLFLPMVKGRKFGKTVSIPLPAFAKTLIAGRTGALFAPIADQICNDNLKILALKADINKRLSFHVSRDTFATMFIELGGDVFTLKEILGHGNIATTQIYVKMSEKRKENMMRNFDEPDD